MQLPPAFGSHRVSLLVLGLALSASPSFAQYSERGSLVGSGAADVDASGRSVKNPRVRAIHSENVNDEGGTAYLIRKDPFLAYQLGRNLNFREFRTRDGVFATGPEGISGQGGPMNDPTVAKITANNQTSCLGCHNLPNGNPGGGANFSKDSGLGRNSPHYYGGGIMEMLAIQNRESLMAELDTDGDGWVSVAESQAAPSELTVEVGTGSGPGVAPGAGPGRASVAQVVSYGNPRLTNATTGRPQFNHIVRVWFGGPDGSGGIQQVQADAIDGLTATHYNFEIVVWGWGQIGSGAALNPTNRAFLWDPFKAHSGLDAYDPSSAVDPDGDGVSKPTLAGAIQFPATHLAPDAGNNVAPAGYSMDDPDKDGYLNEISEGDLDLGEWFMLNAPRPAFAGTKAEYLGGLQRMNSMGCTSCHTPNWTLQPATPDEPWTGDRRLFDLAVSWNEDAGRLEGRLDRLYTQVGDEYVPNLDGFQVRGIFTDLLHHEMGEGFAEKAFDGSIQTEWRTPPLWGVGSGFPWGHDGASLTIEEAILRHGGDALDSRVAYETSSAAVRAEVLSFLNKLVLYDIESLPADIDGDGVISENFLVAGKNTGVERFNAEWLFRVPVEIQGDVQNVDGETVRSFAATNLHDSYGLGLLLRQDSDLDGWPDAWDPMPMKTGYKDGVVN